MKKTSLSLLLLMFCASSLFAQSESNSKSMLYTFDLGAAFLKGTEKNTNLTGYNFNITFEYYGSIPTGGISIGYMRTIDESEDSTIEYSSIPVLLQSKYFLTPDSKAFYIQGGVGIHLSRAEILGKTSFRGDSFAGLKVLLGIGSYSAINDVLFINVSYNFSWMDISSYQDGIVHTIKIGIGFH